MPNANALWKNMTASTQVLSDGIETKERNSEKENVRDSHEIIAATEDGNSTRDGSANSEEEKVDKQEDVARGQVKERVKRKEIDKSDTKETETSKGSHTEREEETTVREDTGKETGEDERGNGKIQQTKVCEVL